MTNRFGFSLVLFGFFAACGWNSAYARNGGADVGGGMAVVCRDEAGKIESVELLDLWEARVVYGRNVADSAAPLSAQIDAALDQLKNAAYAGELCVGTSTNCPGPGNVMGAEALRAVLKFDTDRFLAPDVSQIRRMRGVVLKRTDDSFEEVTPSACAIEQVVRYTDTPSGGFILVNQDLVDRMKPTSVAALYAHEAFYAFLRSNGRAEPSSIRTRRAIGLAFSGYEFAPLESFLPDEYYDCESAGPSRAFLYRDASGVTRLQLVSVDARLAVGFEAPSSGWAETPEEIFAGHQWYGVRTFGDRIGYDFQVSLSMGGEHGEARIRLMLDGGPDMNGPQPEETLTCRKTVKR